MFPSEATIIKKRVKKLTLNIDLELSTAFDLKIECRAKINPPKDPSDDTALLFFSLKAVDTGNTEMEIECEVYYVFKFNCIPDNYDSTITELCAPIAQKETFGIVDAALQSIGYPKLDLSNRSSVKSEEE